MKTNVLIIGSGAREHALGWQITQTSPEANLFFSPGNAGTLLIGKNLNIPVENIEELIQAAKENMINYVVIGPETALAIGLADEFNKVKIPAFGPSKLASRLESDKAWSAEFIKRHNIPQPDFFETNSYEKAKEYLNNHPAESIVIKASGLAAGKGVVLPASKEEAIAALDQIMREKIFGDSGNTVVFQERLAGKEVSVFAISDGKHIALLPTVQDHKRVGDNDTGPNTGGMGAYGPVPFISDYQLEEIKTKIVIPTIRGMNEEGITFIGVLFVGIMMTKDGPKVLEYNVRFGDPETQVLMLLLKTPLLEIVKACATESLNKIELDLNEGSAACISLTAVGYPGEYRKGDEIFGLDKMSPNSSIQAFYAGTKIDGQKVITSGGRVITIAASAKDLKTALELAYSKIGTNGVHFDDMHYRNDIGHQGV